MTTVKRIYRLQKMKIDFMLDVIQALADVVLEYYEEIPNEVLNKMTKIFNDFLITNERIDNARERNINNFYNRLRNKYEGIFNMEVQDEEEKEED
jgi:hypothetical protein